MNKNNIAITVVFALAAVFVTVGLTCSYMKSEMVELQQELRYKENIIEDMKDYISELEEHLERVNTGQLFFEGTGWL